jgi:hypothetical protein
MHPPLEMQSLQFHANDHIALSGDAGTDKESRKLAKTQLKVTASPVQEVEIKAKGARELRRAGSSGYEETPCVDGRI